MQLILLRRRFPPVHLHAAQQRLHLHQQYRWAKGLGEIIVAALADAHDIVQLAVLGREQDDGNIGNRAKCPAHGKPVRAGHHNVQDHQLRRLLTKRLQQCVAAFEGAHGISVACEEAMEQLPDALFIVRQINGMSHASSLQAAPNAARGRSIWHDVDFILSEYRLPVKGGRCRFRSRCCPRWNCTARTAGRRSP